MNEKSLEQFGQAHFYLYFDIRYKGVSKSYLRLDNILN